MAIVKYFWRGVSGDDINDGLTEATAFKGFTAAAPAAALALIAATVGSIANLDSEGAAFRPTIATLKTYAWINLASPHNVTIQTTPGASGNFQFRADAVVATSGWTDVGGGVYSKNIGAGLGAIPGPGGAGVTAGIDTTTYPALDGTNCPAGFLFPEATVTPVGLGTTPDSFFYDDATGLLTIYTPTLDPRTAGGQVTILMPGDINGITMNDAIGCVVQDGVGWLFAPYSASDGYFVKWTTGAGNRGKRLIGKCNGYHTFGDVGSSNYDNAFEDCLAIGGGRASTSFISYSNTSPVYLARRNDSKAIIYPPLTPGGVPVLYPFKTDGGNPRLPGGAGGNRALGAIEVGITGFDAHANPPTSSIADYLCDRCQVYGMLDPVGATGKPFANCMSFGGQDANSIPAVGSDERTWWRYGMRHDQCLSVGCYVAMGVTAGDPAASAFRRSRLTVAGLVGWTLSPYFGAAIADGTAMKIFAECCEFDFGLLPAGSYPTLIGAPQQNKSQRFVLQNNAVLGTPARDHSVLNLGDNGTANDGVNANTAALGGNVIYKAGAIGGCVLFDAQAGPGQITIYSGNWYYQPTNYALWSRNGVGTKADWTANYDTAALGGVYDVNPLFVNAAVSSQPQAASTLYTTRRTIFPSPQYGYNNAMYRSMYGPWQDGRPIFDLEEGELDTASGRTMRTGRVVRTARCGEW